MDDSPGKERDAVRVDQPRVRQAPSGRDVPAGRDPVVMSRQPRSSTGHDLVLAIGGLVGHVQLFGATPAFFEQLLARYEAFTMPALSESRYDLVIRLDMHSPPPPGTRKALADAEAHPLTVTATERTIGLSRWDFGVRLRARGGQRRVSYRGRGRCEMNPFSVDCVLRVLWATLLPRVDGMLVHSCGLRHAEVAVVFPGPSGVGKTTLARKSPDPDDVLSDELCVIRRADDGWRVHGSPFWGDFARGGVSMRSWPLRTLAFLAQAGREGASMTPIVSAEATFRLLGCFLSFATDPATVERNVALATQVASEVRSVEASLTKKVPASAIFRNLSPHLGAEVTRRIPPASTREMISELCYLLRKRGSYEVQNRRRTGVPGAKPGDAIIVRRSAESDLAPGDIALYWRTGRIPDGDTLVCRRTGASTRLPGGLARGRGVVFLGKVELRAADGKPRPLHPRTGDLSSLSGSLVVSLGQQVTRRTT